MEEYGEWYAELAQKKRAFAPIAEINPSMMQNIIKKRFVLDAKDDSYYLLQMIKESHKKSSNNSVRDFVEYAYKAINFYTQKVK